MPEKLRDSPPQQLALSRDGYEFDPDSDLWRLNRNFTARLDWLGTSVASPLATSIRKGLLSYAKLNSAAHTSNTNQRLQAYFEFHRKRDVSPIDFSLNLITQYRQSLNHRNEWYVSVIRTFLGTLSRLHLAGAGEEDLKRISGWRLKPNIKGEAVRTRDPYKGALTDVERQALHAELFAEFEYGELELDTFCLIYLFICTGRRPVQITEIRHCDLQWDDECELNVVQIPRGKQRDGTFRKDFRSFAFQEDFWRCLIRLRKQNWARLQTLRPQCQAQLEPFVPLFPRWRAIKNFDGSDDEFGEAIRCQPLFHRTTKSVGYEMRKTFHEMQVPSPRTVQLQVSPIRLRRTFATRLAEEGYGTLVIAEALDHSDDQSARVYTEEVPENAIAIDAAVAKQIEESHPFFPGRIVRSEADAVRGDDPKSRVRATATEAVGTCGEFGPCGAFAPIACYGCRMFQPWLHGPHELVLRQLIDDRKRIHDATGDKTVAAANDRIILAVRDVIALCAEQLKAEENGVAYESHP